jgi:hypothetical protein
MRLTSWQGAMAMMLIANTSKEAYSVHSTYSCSARIDDEAYRLTAEPDCSYQILLGRLTKYT